MPRKWSKAVPESNGPNSQEEEFGFDQSTLADVYRMIEELFNSARKMEEVADKIREIERRSASLKHGAWQPHLAI